VAEAHAVALVDKVEVGVDPDDVDRPLPLDGLDARMLIE
jgi:hypothetical protein